LEVNEELLDLSLLYLERGFKLTIGLRELFNSPLKTIENFLIINRQMLAVLLLHVNLTLLFQLLIELLLFWLLLLHDSCILPCGLFSLSWFRVVHRLFRDSAHFK
jgi:hypothetical protein